MDLKSTGDDETTLSDSDRKSVPFLFVDIFQDVYSSHTLFVLSMEAFDSSIKAELSSQALAMLLV